MSPRPPLAAFLALLLGLAAHSAPAPVGPPTTDAQGDPLPPRALARVGTTRLRQPQINCLAFTPDGKALASGGSDHTIRLWSAKSGRELRRLVGHRHVVHCLAISRDG